MTENDTSTLATQAAFVVESALMLAGIFLLWRHCLRPEIRANPPPTALRRWSLSLFEFGVFIWFVSTGGIFGQLLTLQGLKLFSFDTETQQIIAGAAFQFGMLAGCVGFAWRGPGGRDFDRPRPQFLRKGLATFLIALPLLTGIGLTWELLLELVGLPAERQDLIGMFAEAESPALLISMSVLAIVAAPITEELVFRAGLFRFARTRLPRWAALLVPAMLFGALHGNLASFPQLVTLGIIFSLAYERTGNIAVPMVAHALFNLNTILLILAGFNA